MLTSYTLELRPEGNVRTKPEWGYQLYAALLREAPSGFGTQAHTNGATPISQYLRRQGGRLIWTVSLLGHESEAALCPVVENLSVLRLEGGKLPLAVSALEKREIVDVDALFAAPGDPHCLRFQTPAAFKSRGQYVNLPTPHLLLQSLARQWNGCVAECPIEDEDGEGLEAMAAGLCFREFRLNSAVYHLKGQPIPGFTGTLTVENRLSGFHRQLADALLNFSCYAGVGIKTALGMGGMERQSIA